MSNYSTSANIVLSVNGKQAEKMLSSLEKDAKRLETAIAKAAQAGDKATAKKLQRDLASARRTMEQLRGSASSVEKVLRNLDKATPKELNRALKQLQQELNGIQRGTAAWDAHVEKIKAVKAELQKVNATMATQQSRWSRFNSWLNDTQTAILGVGAAITGFVMAGRKAVNAYAEMEQEMANVRKYTGMTEEQVAKLNEEFKKIDTRTSREELNRLAQEAGRLGKTSMEDVVGFVRAANQINVALNDLGEGATLTLSKLTGIFGDEERLGTEKSLLAVGSVINELSQNCAASAPYLAEFASRMGGVGSQAGMTIQEIMGFGAVLDSNNQVVEASATAVGQVLTRMYRDPAKYAAPAGLEVKKFSELLKTDANGALILLLESLNKMGNMDVLSPIFADMGENGARAISALSTLAKNIDEVKSQQAAANVAFAEATSVTKEYDVQNNTVQAGLDKAKKGLNEIAVELGQKLAPVMRHVISSSSLMLRALYTMIDFISKHTTEILTITAAFVAYQLAVHASTIAFKAHYAWLVITQKATVLLQGGTIILRMAYYALTGQIRRATAAYTAFHLLTKATPWGAILAGVTAVVVGLIAWTKRTNDLRKAQEQQRKEQQAQLAAMRDVSKEGIQYAKNEVVQLELLYEAATDEARSKEERIKAANKLKSLYPEEFANLTTEQILVGKAKDEYLKLRDSILEAAMAKAAMDKVTANQSRMLELKAEVPTLEAQVEEDKKKYDHAKANSARVRSQNEAPDLPYTERNFAGRVWYEQGILEEEGNAKAAYEASVAALTANQEEQEQLEAANEFLKKEHNLALAVMEKKGGGGGDGDTTTDKFAAEKEWRAKEEALARISYATGETDYLAHTRRMQDILAEYYERQLSHTDLTEGERLQILSQWHEQAKNMEEQDATTTLEKENQDYNDRLAELKQFYIDGQISKQTYDLRIEEAEIEHQHNLAKLTKEGSKERAAADANLQNLLIAQMQRRQRETEKLEQKFAKMKQQYFGDNPQEKQAKYDADLAALTIVYNRELQAAENNAAEKLRIEEAFQKAKLALQKEYGILSEEETTNSMQRGIEQSVEWLQSDGGQALTGTMDTLVSGMSAIFSQLSSLIQAELEIQTASINKRYDAEISRAEGNSYKVAKLEKQKEKELAKAKNEANKKMYAMQVIQAIAQTATGAIAAYSSAAAIPVIGWIMAPIAAGMAVAAGMIQVAAIKKQQQASEAQGYAEGGFTPEGDRLQPVGVVHAGEWVASQKLTHNPRTRPLLEALDYAQRNNTIGSLTPSAVSAMMPAKQTSVLQAASPNVVVNVPQTTTDSTSNRELTQTIAKLQQRLDEPFVTINTVYGDHGIQKAQEEYDLLLKNKTSKSRR